ncbi:MAG: hypothetical protein ACRDVP_01675, partial [Acidimicrobiales bacterium]
VGLVLQLLALALAPISVVQPIFASGIVLLLILSHRSLHERLGKREWYAIGLVIIALLMISFSLDSASDRVGDGGSLATLAATAGPTVAAALVLFRIADRSGTHRHGAWRSPLYGLAPGLLYGVSTLALKAISVDLERDGLWGFAEHIVGSPYLYALLIAAVLGFLCFQTGLQRSSASVLVPVSSVVSSAYVIGFGTVLFGEHLPSSTWRLILRLVGFLFVATSVAMLATASQKTTAGSSTIPQSEPYFELESLLPRNRPLGATGVSGPRT